MYGDNRDFQLADILEKADIIPKLYQRTYVEMLYQKMKNVKTPYQDEQILSSQDVYLSDRIWNNDAMGAVFEILSKSHERQNEICDFNDSPLPIEKIGRCEYDNHFENFEGGIELTEEEQEIWEKINEEEGYEEAWNHFIDKINPDNQNLRLILYCNEDETKVLNDFGEYVCESCMEEVIDNCDGGMSCDMETVEE